MKLHWGRERKLAAAFAIVVTLLRVFFSRKATYCGVPDSCYYLSMAQSLGSGRGFFSRFLYDFQLPVLRLPNTGIEYWRPGTSFLLLLARPFGALTVSRADLVEIAAGLLLALAAWFIARRARASEAVCAAAFCLALVLPSTWDAALEPDSSLSYGFAVAWFLALFTVEWQGVWADILALACVAFAYLIRNDAGLLLAPALAVLLLRLRQARGKRADAVVLGARPGYVVAMIAGFFAALAPMHLLYWRVLGTAFPKGTSTVLWMADLSEFNYYDQPLNLHTLLAHGIKPLLVQRVMAAVMIPYRVVALMIGYVAIIFLLGWWSRQRAAEHDRSMPEWVGAAVFGAVLWLVYSFGLPAVGVFSALRSTMALLPFLSVLIVLGLVRAAADRRMAGLLCAGVLGCLTVSGVMADRRGVEDQHERRDMYGHLQQVLQAMGADTAHTVVMTPDPIQFSVTTGFAALPVPSNGSRAIAAAAQRFHAGYLLLNSKSLPKDMDALRTLLHPVREQELLSDHTLILKLPQAQ